MRITKGFDIRVVISPGSVKYIGMGIDTFANIKARLYQSRILMQHSLQNPPNKSKNGNLD